MCKSWQVFRSHKGKQFLVQLNLSLGEFDMIQIIILSRFLGLKYDYPTDLYHYFKLQVQQFFHPHVSQIFFFPDVCHQTIYFHM